MSDSPLYRGYFRPLKFLTPFQPLATERKIYLTLWRPQKRPQLYKNQDKKKKSLRKAEVGGGGLWVISYITRKEEVTRCKCRDKKRSRSVIQTKQETERLRCCAPRWLNPEFLLPFPSRSGGATAGHSPIPFAFACARPDVRMAEVVPAGETVGAAGTGAAAAADTPPSAAVGRAPGHS